MIAAIVIWLFMLLVASVYGLATLHWLGQQMNWETVHTPNLSLGLLVGLVVIAIAAQIVNLFIPLGAVFVLGLLAGAVWLIFHNRLLLNISLPVVGALGWIFVLLVFLTILENATHFAANPDTGFYHAQSIRWFETYRIVPGLGNLQERFAFNSSWMVLNAALSLSFLGLQSFRLVSGMFFLSAMLFFAEGVYDLIRKKISLAGFIKILFLVAGFYLLGSEISSVGNDMPVSLIIWVMLVLWIECIEFPTTSEMKSIVIFILSVFALTVKLSSAPLLLFALYIVAEYTLQKDWKQMRLLIIVGGVIVIPWLIRSVILSGYLVFPLSQIDLFSFDWKIPEIQVETTRLGITHFARYGGDTSSTLDMPVTQWAPVWFDDFTVNRQAIFLLSLVSPVILIFERRWISSIVSNKYLFAYGIVFLGSVFWFLAAPDIRFGYGFLIGTCVLAIVPMIMPVLFKLNRVAQSLPRLIWLCLFAFQFYTLWQSVEPAAYPRRFFLPADYHPAKVEVCEIKNATIYCQKEEGTKCQYALFPCIPFLRPDVEMRGETFQDGFRYPPGFGQ